MVVYHAVVLENMDIHEEYLHVDEDTIGIYSSEAFAQVGIDWYREQRTKDGEDVALLEATGQLECVIRRVVVDTHLIYP